MVFDLDLPAFVDLCVFLPMSSSSRYSVDSTHVTSISIQPTDSGLLVNCCNQTNELKSRSRLCLLFVISCCFLVIALFVSTYCSQNQSRLPYSSYSSYISRALHHVIDTTLLSRYGSTSPIPSSMVVFSDSVHLRLNRASSSSPASVLLPGTSIIAACKDRSDTLLQVLPTWLTVKEVVEIILVDWSSDRSHSILSLLRTHNFSHYLYDSIHNNDTHPTTNIRIKLAIVHEQQHFHLSMAYNLAASLSSAESILKLDCDSRINNPDFISLHPSTSHDSIYYHGNWKLGPDTNAKHINGILYIKRHEFFAVGGYDERFHTYGYEDNELYERLQSALSLKPLDIAITAIEHRYHSHTRRRWNDEQLHSSEVQIAVNRLMSRSQSPWNSSTPCASFIIHQHREFDGIINVYLHSKPLTYNKLVTSAQREVFQISVLHQLLSSRLSIPTELLYSSTLSQLNAISVLVDVFPCARSRLCTSAVCLDTTCTW